jgi:hypothetical protein
MERTDRSTWLHWVDAWLSGLPRGSAKESAAEATAWMRKLDLDREEAIRPLGSTRFPSIGVSAEAGAAQPIALAG